MDEHRSARSLLRRALAHGTRGGVETTAAVVDPADLERALAHLAACEECRRRFDIAETAAWLESREGTHPMAQAPVDPLSLFESALTAALSDPEGLVRRRAAARLGDMTGLGAATVEALAAAAREDRDERVRAAALAALQRLDSLASLPPWATDVRSPAAASYLTGVLARLAGPAATTGVTRLERATTQYGEAVALFGERGVSGRVSREPDGLWLMVKGLPPEVEDSETVVAVPKAFGVEALTVLWAGQEPGLIVASEHVADGSLRVRLGSVREGGAQPGGGAQPAAAAPPRLFDQIYLLHAKDRRKKV